LEVQASGDAWCGAQAFGAQAGAGDAQPVLVVPKPAPAVPKPAPAVPEQVVPKPPAQAAPPMAAPHSVDKEDAEDNAECGEGMCGEEEVPKAEDICTDPEAEEEEEEKEDDEEEIEGGDTPVA
jgi:hypothetical protein